jgi:hypothetical protein
MLSYVVVPMEILNEPNNWIKIVIPIDALHIVNKMKWLWAREVNDAYPVGFGNIQAYSFRIAARLFSNVKIIDENTLDLRDYEDDIDEELNRITPILQTIRFN